jgi:hypothetical protein
LFSSSVSASLRVHGRDVKLKYGNLS